MNISSIRFKPLAGRITLALLPLLAVGITSITKSANGFHQLGQNAMQTTAADDEFLGSFGLVLKIDFFGRVSLQQKDR